MARGDTAGDRATDKRPPHNTKKAAERSVSVSPFSYKGDKNSQVRELQPHYKNHFTAVTTVMVTHRKNTIRKDI